MSVLAPPPVAHDGRPRMAGLARQAVRIAGPPVAAFAAFLLLLGGLDDPYWARLVALVGFWALVGMSWNIIGGYAGQPSFGHSAFVGIGAYTTALLLERDVPPWLGLPCGVGLACLAALLIGAPTLRLRDVYFALATLVYPLILGLIVTWLGLQEVLVSTHPDAPLLFMSWVDARAYAVAFGLLILLAWIALTLLERSRLRLILAAIRLDEATAVSTGIDAPRVKLACFVASAGLGALAGGIYIQLVFVVTPGDVLSFDMSIQAILIALVGGIARRGGPLIGAAILIPVANLLESSLGGTSGGPQLAYGLALILVVTVMPRGLFDQAERRFPRRRRAPAVTTPMPVAIATPLPPRQPFGNAHAPVLEVRGLRRHYGGVIAVAGVDLTIRAGEFVGLVGPNGAGKSTLFDLITGYQRPTAGQILVCGIDMSGRPAHALARAGLRRTFQTARPFRSMTVLENALLGVGSDRGGTALRMAAARNALDAVGLGALAEERAGALVPSQLRLLEVARAIAGAPALLLLDEPLAGLTPAESDHLLGILARLNAGGPAVVLVDHNVGSVARTVRRLAVLDRGRLIADGPPDAVLRDPRVVESYLGRPADAA